jgi:L-seryl-tRNA(Ser) seleniumtransferase
MTDPRRALPSVGSLLERPGVRALLDAHPRSLVAEAVREAVEAARRDPGSAPASDDAWIATVTRAVAQRARPSLRAVLNATGVVLHTNLGRAPLATAALDAIREAAEGYSNLEYDLARGERGSRYDHCVGLLTELTGAEDALVVNNCAAALVLALDTLARDRDAIVSRGELVEIGGSFRVPDIMGKSGARLVEVGTTNRTHLDDYRRALGDGAGAMVKVHRSNFTLDGFVAEVPVRELAVLAGEFGVPLVHDFGSGLLLDLAPWGLGGEPTLRDALREGPTLLLASGDKLLGGPQAGIVLGAREAVRRMARNPLTRALRVDKLTLASLHATLALYRDPAVAVREVPALAMLTAPVDSVRARATALCEALRARGVACDTAESEASVGGGAFPTARIASACVTLEGDAGVLERRLREGELPVIGRIADGRLRLDLRSVPARDDRRLLDAIAAALGAA